MKGKDGLLNTGQIKMNDLIAIKILGIMIGLLTIMEFTNYMFILNEFKQLNNKIDKLKGRKK